VVAEGKKTCFENYRRLAKTFPGKTQNQPSVRARYSKSQDLHLFFLKIIEISDSIIGDDFTIDWSLPFSDYENLSNYKTLFCLSFAKDNDGNSFHIYDATKENSPIIFKSHDPEMMIVVAHNLCDFIHSLQKYSSERSLDTLNNWFESELSDYLEKTAKVTEVEWDKNDLRGMTLDKKENSIQIDFSNAKVGAGISLSYFGDLTRLKRNFKSGKISLFKPSKEEVKKHKLEKTQVHLALIGIPSAFFVFFLIDSVLDKTPILSSIFIVPFMTLMASIGTFCLG